MRLLFVTSILSIMAVFSIGGEFDPPDIEIDLSKEEFRQVSIEWRISPIALTEEGVIVLPGEPYVLSVLDHLGISYRISEKREREKAASALRRKLLPGSYFDPDSFEAWATQLVNTHSSITDMIQVGTSVNGRPLWAIKVTDFPETEEFEPELRIIGNIHGDELSGLMVCTDVLEWIVTNYGSDPLADRLVNESEMWFMPMVNPDGNATDSRFNANWVDLNRNFDGPDGSGTLVPFSEPETQAVRALSQTYGNKFVLGLTFHSGAACFNSVWNFDINEPLSDLPNFFSSRTGGLPCHNNVCAVPSEHGLAQAYKDGSTYPEFWYVFGADWYETTGDTNDWAYHFESTLDTTIEVTEFKTPAASQIPIFTEQHRHGVLNYLDKVFQGIYGLVTDSVTGDPLDATITVGAFKPVPTDPTLGDYHRFCVPGTYAVTVSAPGYPDQVFSDVVVQADMRTRLDVAMAVAVTYDELVPHWPGAGPFDSNNNQRVDILDLLSLLNGDSL